MKNKKKWEKETITLKLDMSKAYYKIEWDFVFGALEATEFHGDTIRLIRRCTSTVSYQILLNWQPSNKFMLERGFLQGDPLSPLLLIICADVFSDILKS